MKFSDYKTTNEAIDALNAKGVFEVQKLEEDEPLEFDDEGKLTNYTRRLKVIVSIVHDVVLSKANFKAYADVAPKYQWSGYAIKKNANFDFGELEHLDAISDKNNKRSNKYHKEVLEGRMSGAYKQKVREGEIWNTGGHETGEAALVKKAMREVDAQKKAEVAIPPSFKACVDQAKSDSQLQINVQKPQSRRL